MGILRRSKLGILWVPLRLAETSLGASVEETHSQHRSISSSCRHAQSDVSLMRCLVTEGQRDAQKQQERIRKTKREGHKGWGQKEKGVDQDWVYPFFLHWFETDLHFVSCPSHKQWDINLCSGSRGSNSKWMSISLCLTLLVYYTGRNWELGSRNVKHVMFHIAPNNRRESRRRRIVVIVWVKTNVSLTGWNEDADSQTKPS